MKIWTVTLHSVLMLCCLTICHCLLSFLLVSNLTLITRGMIWFVVILLLPFGTVRIQWYLLLPNRWYPLPPVFCLSQILWQFCLRDFLVYLPLRVSNGDSKWTFILKFWVMKKKPSPTAKNFHIGIFRCWDTESSIHIFLKIRIKVSVFNKNRTLHEFSF